MQKNEGMSEQDLDLIPLAKEHLVEVRMAYTTANSDIDTKNKVNKYISDIRETRKRQLANNSNEMTPNKRYRYH